jgi:hypothetical protein
MPVTDVRDDTVAGVDAINAQLPSPSCPRELLPQQRIVWSVFTAHAWDSPVKRAITPVNDATDTAVYRLVKLPSPS